MDMDMVVVLGPKTVASPWNSDEIYTFFEKPYKKTNDWNDKRQTNERQTNERPTDQTTKRTRYTYNIKLTENSNENTSQKQTKN